MSATTVLSPRSSASSSRRLPFPSSINTSSELEYQRAVSNFLSTKDRPFVVSGSIPILADEPLILFFRTSTGISHSLPFPLKTDSLHQLPALNVLLASCETTFEPPFDQPDPIIESTERERPLVWPRQLPFSTTFELANHPVLDTVRSVLFPNCYPGTYLFARRTRLEIVLAGAHSEPRRPSSPRGMDGAKLAATLVVTFPVRFRGGALAVRDPEGATERVVPPAQVLHTNEDTQLHWTAFLADCEHEFEFVEQGCRISMSYAVYMKTFGPAGSRPNPLIVPSDELLEALSPVLNLSRGQRVGIYLTGRYDCSPGDILADSLVPSLKGGDAVLYHALRLFKLTPELHWAVGGYIWPADKTVQLGAYSDRDELQSFTRLSLNTNPYSAPNSPKSQSGQRSRQRRRSFSRSVAEYERSTSVGRGRMSVGSRSVISDLEAEDDDDLRDRIMESGAMLLHDTDIMLLTARDQSVSRERVPFVSRGGLDKLSVNILMVAYVQ